MDEIKEQSNTFERAIGDFLGIVQCLLIITDVKGYKEWINKYHSKKVEGSDVLPHSYPSIVEAATAESIAIQAITNLRFGILSLCTILRRKFRKFIVLSTSQMLQVCLLGSETPPGSRRTATWTQPVRTGQAPSRSLSPLVRSCSVSSCDHRRG